ncbi:MAG: SH3 domain-containing protein [Chlamydiae bacterium]|nr:SH3 domain-containing protein [Chlamydiota bacterium]
MKLSLGTLLIFLLCGNFSPAIFCEETSLQNPEVTFPFLGKVSEDHVNVRAGGNLDYEILVKLSRDTSVLVYKEVYGWYEIACPEDVFFWVNGKYVEHDQVTTSTLNVRLRPNVDSFVICQLMRGDAIQKVGEEGEWLKIKPPPNARGWIRKDLVTYALPDGEGTKTLGDTDPLKLKEARKEMLLHEAEELEKEEFKPKIPEEEVALASVPVVAQPIEALSSESAVKAEPVLQAGGAGDGSEKSFEGYLEMTGGLSQRSKRYKLIQDQHLVCMIEANSFQMERYLHQAVKVSGVQVSQVYRRIPVIELTKIDRVSVD